MNDLMPYLVFNGDCAAAFDFYKESLDGKIEYMGKYGDSPMEVPDDQNDKVVHTTISSWGGLFGMFVDIAGIQWTISSRRRKNSCEYPIWERH